MHELISSIRRNAVGLAIFATVTAGAIATAQMLTAERIKQNIRMAESRALNQLVPTSSYDNDLLNDTLTVDSRFNQQLLGPLPENALIYRARNDGEVSAVILPAVAPDGYTTSIDLIVGVNRDGTLAGVRVVAHRETPGLGDKIEARKSDWITSFTGKSLQNPVAEQWAVRKDGGEFDQFTGATITPRAVVRAVKRALLFFDMHRDLLLNGRAPYQGDSNGN
ncbi:MULTISPECIES: electron transport complex subunit RsxG [Gammaproteobacteria]|uniref:electron transport complex subunit RsxG n=1 Tax=Thalassolituus sp. TaxID=2030822 RepID=UPI0025918639|nr:MULTISPECIES: electron transport complex subunit RsxG [Gammaproteobacteria]